MNQKQSDGSLRDKTEQVAEETQAQAADVKETVQDRAHDVAHVAEEKAGQVADEAKEQARRVGHTVETEARSMAASRKRQVASELQSAAQAFHASGNQLRAQGQDTVAAYTEKVGEQLTRASLYLEHRNVEEMVSDAEDFARRQPELVLAGAFGLGMLLSRFLKSSRATGQQRSSRRDRYGRPITRRARPLPQQNTGENVHLYPRDET